MKRIFYSLLFAGTVWTAASQNPPEIKTPDRKAAERIEEYYLSKMLPDSVQIKAPSLYPADYFSPSTTMTPVISMSSLMEIRTKYALRRIDIVPYKIRSGWFSISNGQAQNWSPYPDGHLDARTLSFPLPRERSHSCPVRHAIEDDRTVFQTDIPFPGANLLREIFVSNSRIRKFGYLCVTDSGKKIASLHTR